MESHVRALHGIGSGANNLPVVVDRVGFAEDPAKGTQIGNGVLGCRVGGVPKQPRNYQDRLIAESL